VINMLWEAKRSLEALSQGGNPVRPRHHSTALQHLLVFKGIPPLPNRIDCLSRP
jgi:hypothetical protein